LEIPLDYLTNFKCAEMTFLYQRVFDIDTQRLITLSLISEGIDITQDRILILNVLLSLEFLWHYLNGLPGRIGILSPS
ncbi:17758_t:CDS:1, partial [Acaulospora morrowiae]